MIYFPLWENESTWLFIYLLLLPEALAVIVNCRHDSDFVGEQHGSLYFALRYSILYFEASDKNKNKNKTGFK